MIKRFFLILLVSRCLIACASQANSVDTTSPYFGSSEATYSEQLFDQYCYGCHAQEYEDLLLGATATGIQSAIDNDLGSMKRISFLSEEDIIAIAEYLCIRYPGSCD